MSLFRFLLYRCLTCNQVITISSFFLILNEILVESAGQYRVFTQDRYRTTYVPNTVPEEMFTEWDAADVPNPAFLVNEEQIFESHHKVTSFLSEFNSTSTVTTIRCPFGWSPIGPFCTTLSNVHPYTQCPMDMKLFEIGPGNPVVPSFDLPGLCFRHESTGLSFQCPKGYNLILLNETENGKSFQSYVCEMEDTIPYTILRNPPQFCSNGFSPNQSGCSGDKLLPPEVTCPDGWSLNSFVADPYAFNGRQRLDCIMTTTIKGKVWCPEGYHISGELFPGIPFGAILDMELNSTLPQFQLTPEAHNLSMEGWLHDAGFELFDSLICFKVLVVIWNHCNNLECENSHLNSLRHILINWGYLIQTNPDHVVYGGIPSGRDFRFTNSGVRRTSI